MTTYHLAAEPNRTFQAEQFNGTNLPSLIDVDGDNTATGAFLTGTEDGKRTMRLDCQIAQPNGSILYAGAILQSGDWVLLEDNGNVLMSPASNFAETYEPVDATP